MLSAEDLAARFYATLVARDWTAMRALFTKDARWILPGDNPVSALATGPDAIIARVQLIASYGVSFQLQHVLFSRHNMALAFHNTAQQDDVQLDEHLATVCRLKDGLIDEIETFLSDVPGMNHFFNQATAGRADHLKFRGHGRNDDDGG